MAGDGQIKFLSRFIRLIQFAQFKVASNRIVGI